MTSENIASTLEPAGASGTRRGARRKSDAFVFALFMFPAVWALFALPDAWWGHALRVVPALWLLILQSAAFREQYAARKDFGLMVLASALAFAACLWLYPGAAWQVAATGVAVALILGTWIATRLEP